MSFTLPRGHSRGPLCGGRHCLGSEREEDVLSGLDGLHAGDSSSVRNDKHAVGVKKRKSSNERDSRLPGFVPSLHMVAASTTATSSQTATDSSATNAVLLDDDDVDFGRGGYVDGYGHCGGGGDASTTVTAGGGCVSMAVTTSGNSHNLDGYDSDCIYVPSIPPAGPSKRSLPLGFVHLSEVIKLRMLSKLDSNSSAANIDSFGKNTLKRMLEGIVGEKEYLLQYAAQVDPVFRDMIDDVLPDRVTARMKKHTVCEHLVDLWDILRFLHSKRDLVIARGNQLSTLLPLMERMEAKIKQEMDRVDEVDKNVKAYKIPSEMQERGYL